MDASALPAIATLPISVPALNFVRMSSSTDKLTDKQAKFCEEYMLDLNATQAAIRAGYSVDTARQMGAENLSKPDISDRIAELQAERSKTTKIDAAWLLSRLAAEADADVNDIYDEFGAVRPISEWPTIFRKGLIAGIEVEELVHEVDDPDADFDEPRKITVKKGRVVKFKLDSRVKRLELIGRHIGVQAFRENVNLTGAVAVANIPAEDLPDEVLRTLAGITLDKP